MKSLLLLTTDRVGHVNPALFHAKKFIEAGWEVIFPSSEKFRDLIRENGCKFVELKLEQGFDYVRPKNFTLVGGASEVIRLTKNILPVLKGIVEQHEPSLILTDTVAFWGKILSRETGIPVISYSSVLAFDAKVFEKYDRLTDVLGLGDVRDLYGIAKILKYSSELKKVTKKTSYFDIVRMLFNNYSKINIVHTSREFQPLQERFKKGFYFIGPAVDANDFNVKLGFNIDKNSVFISLGSSFTDNIQFYKNILNFYRSRRTQVILSIPDDLAVKLNVKQYPNVISGSHERGKTYINQKAVLRKVKYFITHAGFNSTMESTFAGTPMICVPQMIEQEINALRVKELGMGIILSKTPKISDICLAISEMEEKHEKFNANVEKVRNSFESCDKYEQILKYAEKFAK